MMGCWDFTFVCMSLCVFLFTIRISSTGKSLRLLMPFAASTHTCSHSGECCAARVEQWCRFRQGNERKREMRNSLLT